MRKTTFTITVLHLFPPSSTLSAETKSHIFAVGSLYRCQREFVDRNESFL